VAGGLLAGLRSTYADNVAVCYADTPFVAWGIYCKLFEAAPGHQGAVLEAKGQRHYNIGVYSRLPTIKTLKTGVEGGIEDLSGCLEGLDLAIVPEEDILDLDPEMDCLLDVDTQGDLRRANEVLERRQATGDEGPEC
jgi:molybdopterin-guanine dinucleotide biosynthesis protein A